MCVGQIEILTKSMRLVFGILATLPFSHSIQCYSGSFSSAIDCRATTPRPTTISTWSTWTYRPPTTYRPWHWHWNKPHRPWWHYNHHGHHWHHWHRSGTLNLTNPGGDAVILAKLVADAEKNCYIAYELSSGITTARGCGVGGDLVQYLQGTPYVFWENSVCFSRPGFNDTQEVCICTRDGCNKDYTSSRATYAYYPRLGEGPNVTSIDGEEGEVVDSREVLVGTRERDFDSLLPGNSINKNKTRLEKQPCFVCSFQWVLNGGPAGGESSFNENEKKIDLPGSGVESQIVKSREGTVESQPGIQDEGGDKDSTIASGEGVKEVKVSNNAGLKVGNGKIANILPLLE